MLFLYTAHQPNAHHSLPFAHHILPPEQQNVNSEVSPGVVLSVVVYEGNNRENAGGMAVVA
jgi:hypothetical protein